MKNIGEQDNEAIEFLGNIQTSFKGMKLCMIVCAAASVIISIGSVISANHRAEKAERNIYIIDEGSVLEAARADNGEQRDLEIMDHVTRFHELFFNLAPNITTINQNIERALELADKSAYEYFSDLKEDKYYARLIDINATQQVSVDSVSVDMNRYPYKVKTMASLYVLRESNVSMYRFSSTCDVTEIARSKTNPHGLMINNYYATKPELVGTTKR